MAQFDWYSYLKLANDLMDCDKDDPLIEAKLRSAISRAYYSVFIPARNHLKDNGRRCPIETPTHKWVINEYKTNSNKDWQVIGDQLDQLRGYRHKADYEDRYEAVDYDVDVAIEIADDTINLLQNMRNLRS